MRWYAIQLGSAYCSLSIDISQSNPAATESHFHWIWYLTISCAETSQPPLSSGCITDRRISERAMPKKRRHLCFSKSNRVAHEVPLMRLDCGNCSTETKSRPLTNLTAIDSPDLALISHFRGGAHPLECAAYGSALSCSQTPFANWNSQ